VIDDRLCSNATGTFNSAVATFDITLATDLMEPLTAIGIAAATTILGLRDDTGFRTKADGSPVTRADETAEAVIRERLTRLACDLPIVSEEEAEHTAAALGASRSGAPYCLVDPLDGTREFIAGRDEYTVNIAIVSAGTPVLGIIVAPALGLIWRGAIGLGAERLPFAAGKAGPPQKIQARPRPTDELVVMVSRSHLDARTQAYLGAFANVRRLPCGSSLKFCRLAEGSADHYPRLGPTRDWDVAAGHAILAAAGGRVTAPDGADLTYGSAALLIPSFLAWGAAPA
jgi:3'(2'), 5'-bisphosphate nucleotidase